MPSTVTREEAEQHFPHFVSLARNTAEDSEEAWLASYWMTPSMGQEKYRERLWGEIDILENAFFSELFSIYRDWLETMSEDQYEQHLNRLTNRVLF